MISRAKFLQNKYILGFTILFLAGCVTNKGVDYQNTKMSVHYKIFTCYVLHNQDEKHEYALEICIDTYGLDLSEPDYFQAIENKGLTCANVRLFLNYAMYGSYEWIPEQWLKNVSRIKHYKVFLNDDNSPVGESLVFTTEATVFDFTFFRVERNANFGQYGERFYNIIYTYNSINKFLPEVPLVVFGISRGCANAAFGFSFFDKSGNTHYFVIIGGMTDFEPHVYGARF